MRLGKWGMQENIPRGDQGKAKHFPLASDAASSGTEEKLGAVLQNTVLATFEKLIYLSTSVILVEILPL